MAPGEKPVMAGLSSQVEHKKSGRRLLNHHIQVTFKHDKSNVFLSPDDLEIYLSLYSAKTSSYLSERVLVDAKNKDKRDMVFMDVGTLDQCRELHLVVHVFRIGKMIPGTMGSSSTFVSYDGRKASGNLGTLHKRPFAVGVINISKLVTRP